MLRGLILENFKAFGGRRVIPIRPITLIFGPNSAGKSAILQSLLILKQTITDPDTGDTPVRLKGSLVDLGGFQQMVHRRNSESSCEITPVLEIPDHADRFPMLNAIHRELAGVPRYAGIGPRITFDSDTAKPEISSLPIYFGDYTDPVAVVRSTALSNELRAGINAEILEVESTLRKLDTQKDELFVEENAILDELIKVLRSLVEALKRTEPESPDSLTLSQTRLILEQKREEIRKRIAEIDEQKSESERQRVLLTRSIASVASDSRLSELLSEHDNFPILNRDHSLWQTLFARYREKDYSRFEALLEDPNAIGSELWQGHSVWMFDTIVKEKLPNMIVDDIEKYCNGLENETLVRALSPHKFTLHESAITNPDPQLTADSVHDLAALGTLLDQLFVEGGRGRWPSLADMAIELSDGLVRWLRGLLYLGPLRSIPERHYQLGNVSGSSVGTKGEFAPEFLLTEPDLEDEINQTLAKLEVNYALKASPLLDGAGTSSDLFSLRLIDTKSGVELSLKDVGFGIGQVLPVIVQSMIARENTVLVEQPELHLHPRLQAELGDVFIKSALERKNTFLIETHSEHLVLRIMRRIRETSRRMLPDGLPELRPDEVSIIYVHPMEDGSGSVPIVIDLDEDGELMTPWPNGFFEEGFNERFA